MKKLISKKIILCLLVFSTSIYAQSKDFLLTKTYIFKSFNLDLKTNNYTLDFKNINLSKDAILFSSYNETTKLNDSYFLNNDKFIYNKSNLLLENSFRGNKIDSFNPYGTSNVGSALILGLVGSIIN